MTRVLPPAVRRDLWLAWALQATAALAVAFAAGWGAGYVAQAMAGMSVAVWLVARAYCGDGAAHARFGPANRVTLMRLAATMLLAAVVAELPVVSDGSVGPMGLAWTLVAVTAVVAVLDAVDGPFARRSGMASAFGARFDMETDAWFTLVLCVLVWRFDRAGVWVLASGGMRYVFVAAAWRWPWLAAPLAPSRRRQTACVVQIVLLIVALAPLWSRGVSSVICAAGLMLLVGSFAVDVQVLWRQRGRASAHGTPARP